VPKIIRFGQENLKDTCKNTQRSRFLEHLVCRKRINAILSTNFAQNLSIST